MNEIDYIIIGCQRCGTSSLYVYCTAHPQFHGMTLDNRPRPNGGDEIHFFDYDRHYFKGMDWYLSHIPTDYNGIVGEKSPTYLHAPKAPARIAATFPDVRLIVLLRDPVERAFSHYWKARNVGYETLETFEEALAAEPGRLAECNQDDFENSALHLFSYVKRGQYADYLGRWLDFFDPSQFIIIQSEVFFDRDVWVISFVWRCFGLHYPRRLNRPAVRHQSAKKESVMRKETHDALYAHFAPYNHRLWQMINEDFAGANIMGFKEGDE